MKRFKIDRNEYSVSFANGYHFALFARTTRNSFFFGTVETGWDYIGNYKTMDEARAVYETLKDLPEYLD